MPGSEEFVQSAVHALEAGGLVVWVKRGAVAFDIAGIVVLYFYQFRSLSTSQGMGPGPDRARDCEWRRLAHEIGAASGGRTISRHRQRRIPGLGGRYSGQPGLGKISAEMEHRRAQF